MLRLIVSLGIAFGIVAGAAIFASAAVDSVPIAASVQLGSATLAPSSEPSAQPQTGRETVLVIQSPAANKVAATTAPIAVRSTPPEPALAYTPAASSPRIRTNAPEPPLLYTPVASASRTAP